MSFPSNLVRSAAVLLSLSAGAMAPLPAQVVHPKPPRVAVRAVDADYKQLRIPRGPSAAPVAADPRR